MKKIKEYLLKDRTPFTEGLSFKKMFLIFVIFSFLGCIYEDILFMAKNYINYGILDYSTKRGLLYLELSPIFASLCGVDILIPPSSYSYYHRI